MMMTMLAMLELEQAIGFSSMQLQLHPTRHSMQIQTKLPPTETNWQRFSDDDDDDKIY